MVLARCSRLLFLRSLPLSMLVTMLLSLLVWTLVSMVMLSPLTLASTATREAQALIEELAIADAVNSGQTMAMGPRLRER